MGNSQEANNGLPALCIQCVKNIEITQLLCIIINIRI